MPILINLAGGILIILLCLSSQPFGHAEESENVDGAGITTRALWRIDGFLKGPDVAMTNDEILSYQGRPLDMDESSITFDGKICAPITIRRYQTDTALYFSGKLYIHQDEAEYSSPTVDVIETNCDIEGFDEFVRLNDRRLLVPVKGVVFVLEPIVNY